MSSSYELVLYIRNELALNTTREQIMAHLLAAGWKREDIEQALHEVDASADRPNDVVIFPEIKPKSHHIWRIIGRLCIVIVLLVGIAFVVFIALFNLGYIRSQKALNGLQSTSTSNNIVTDQNQNIPQNPTNQNEIISATSSQIQPVNQPVVQPASQPAIQPIVMIPASVSTTTLSASDRNQIIIAILTQNTVLRSSTASGIRNYLKVGASLEYVQQLAAMSDSDILALAKNTLAGTGSVTAAILESSQTIWQSINPVTVNLVITTPNGPVTRTAHNINGVWY